MKNEHLKLEKINRRLFKSVFKIIILFTILLFLLVFLFFSYIFKEEIKGRAFEYTEFVSKLVRGQVLNYNFLEVSRIVNYEIEQKNVLFIAIFDKDGNLISSNLYYVENRDKLGKIEDFNVEKPISNVDTFSLWEGGKSGSLEIFSPILDGNGKKLGYLHIGMVFPTFAKLFRTIVYLFFFFVLVFSAAIFYVLYRSTSFMESSFSEIFLKIDSFLKGNYGERIEFKTGTQLDLLKERINRLFEKFHRDKIERENLMKSFESEVEKKNLTLMRIKSFYENIFDKIGDYVYVVDYSGFVKFANNNFKKKVKDWEKFSKIPLLKFFEGNILNPRKLLKNFLKAYRGKDVFLTEYVKDYDGNLILYDIYMTPIEGPMGERNVLVVGRESIKEVIRGADTMDANSLIQLGKAVYVDLKYLETILENERNISHIENYLSGIFKNFNVEFDEGIRVGNKPLNISEIIEKKVENFKREIPILEGYIKENFSGVIDRKLLDDLFHLVKATYTLFLKDKKIRKIEFITDLAGKIDGEYIPPLVGNEPGKFFAFSITFHGIKFNDVVVSPYEILSEKLNFLAPQVKFFFLWLPFLLKVYSAGGTWLFDRSYSQLKIMIFLPLFTLDEIGKRKEKRGILLVDDEESIVEVVRDYLSEFGYVVFTANCGEDGIEIYKRHKEEIFAIIIDIMMPGMGGEKAYHEFRKLNKDVYIFFASGYTGPDFKESTVLEDNRLSFLNKPFDFDQLLLKLNSMKK